MVRDRVSRVPHLGAGEPSGRGTTFLFLSHGWEPTNRSPLKAAAPTFPPAATME
jgi:hypothetical protein